MQGIAAKRRSECCPVRNAGGTPPQCMPAPHRRTGPGGTGQLMLRLLLLLRLAAKRLSGRARRCCPAPPLQAQGRTPLLHVALRPSQPACWHRRSWLMACAHSCCFHVSPWPLLLLAQELQLALLPQPEQRRCCLERSACTAAHTRVTALPSVSELLPACCCNIKPHTAHHACWLTGCAHAA